VNREFEEYFGNTEYVGRAFDETIHDKGLVDFIKSAYLKEIKMKSEMDSGSRVFDLIATPLFQNKIFIGCIILIHDITIIKNSEKMQKGFIADASHELRTPITSIKGMSEILLRDEDMNIETRKDFLSIIHTEGGRLERIVEDLMQMSRLERSNALSKTEAVNIKEVADEVMKSLEIEATKQNLNLVNHSEGIEIQADRNMIYRLIANLVKNAIAYSDQGDITVSTEQDDDTVTLFISDQGIGIPLEEMDNIFERFYRVDKARTRDSGGTGLGLSICKKIVTLHGGSIDLKSTIGEGTTFEITFNK
jgi:two-component system phosphate regulon sensor histidine kinase PhoR